ncbi:MAG: ATP phosphoribosyltransferase [Desulfovibrio sp.]|nr:ATP phosphoribosyltransferase [Desulfovibrio sp.]
MANGDKLKLGLPKGSLENATLELFGKAGWTIRLHSRNYFPEINDPAISVSLCRSQEMGDFVARGILDAGIAGLDWLRESSTLDKVVRIADLVYSKNSNRPCRWVLAVAGDAPYSSARDLAGKRIATEVKGLASSFFAEQDIPVDIIYSYGATEAKVVEGLADAIVEVTETGATMVAHGLKIIDEVMTSFPVLVANPSALKNAKKKAKLDQIALLLEGALRAERLVALKMNAPADRLDQILEMLPALNSPTISPLRDPRWVSLETVVDKELVRDLIPGLKSAGAEGILEYYLNKVI